MGRARWKYITEGYREALEIPWGEFRRFVPTMAVFVGENARKPSVQPEFFRAFSFEGAMYVWDRGAWTRGDVLFDG